jgi:hypothetical protein
VAHLTAPAPHLPVPGAMSGASESHGGVKGGGVAIVTQPRHHRRQQRQHHLVNSLPSSKTTHLPPDSGGQECARQSSFWGDIVRTQERPGRSGSSRWA